MREVKNSGHIPIGELATRTGLAVSAIRYYEDIGLIPKAARRPSGHRVYKVDSEQLLTLIRRCRDFGFSVEDTRALAALAASRERDCVEARDIAQVHLEAVRAKLAELAALEASLAGFVDACSEQCVGGPAPDCSIFKDLGTRDSKLSKKLAAQTPSGRCCG